MFFRNKEKCKKEAAACTCKNCEAEILHNKTLKALEESRKATVRAKNSISALQRADDMLKTGEFRLPFLSTKKLA